MSETVHALLRLEIFPSLPCRASPCTLNNVPSVPATTANVIVFDTAKFRNGAFLSSSVSIPLHLLR